MKRNALGLALVAAALALGSISYAQSLISKTFSGTASAPSAATDGIDFTGAEGWQVTLAADAGRLFTGSGSAHCYYYGTTHSTGSPGAAQTKAWVRCPAGFDVSPVADERYAVSGSFTETVGAGRLAYRPFALYIVQTDGGSAADAGHNITIEVRRRP
jgi:hypothetical protein